MARLAELQKSRVAALARRWDLVRLITYGFASVAALAVDVGVFLLLLMTQISAAGATALGYCAGIVTHWLLSSRVVFADSVVAAGPQRRLQKVLFGVSALAGLLLTTLIVSSADSAGIDPRIGKVFAIAASFALTWLLRSKIVFRPHS
ncbi:MAG: polysaccharide biosynthesis protein GtrA [Erythrobacter sp.]|nr:polysaccharide biosynthesis protein GtrA [Erythrobacter sp.]|tara:strand:- start:440 stop:883 length:444 start_codon:yes stop_codon:yes gene_type:complete